MDNRTKVLKHLGFSDSLLKAIEDQESRVFSPPNSSNMSRLQGVVKVTTTDLTKLVVVKTDPIIPILYRSK